MEQSKSLEEIDVWEHPPQSGIAQTEEKNKIFFEENQNDKTLRRLHLPSTRGTQSQTFHADWRIIPCSTELHYRYQDYRHDVGCEVGETYWRWNVDGGRELSDMWTCFTRFTTLSEKATGWIYMVREETDEKTTDLVARQIVARNVETYVWCIKTLRETKVGHRETKALQCQTTESNILH